MKVTQDHIFALGWKLFRMRLDMAPSDYYLFRSLQHHLADTQLNDARFENIRKCIDDFIASKPESSCRQEIRKLSGRWQRLLMQTGNILLINIFLFVFE